MSKWLSFMVEDVQVSIPADKIVRIKECGDDLTIATSDGKEVSYEGVVGVGWVEEPKLTYWQACVPGLLEAKEAREAEERVAERQRLQNRIDQIDQIEWCRKEANIRQAAPTP